MPRLRSFRLRIALFSVVLSGLVLAAFAAWAWYMVQRANLGRVDDSLRDIAQRHLSFPHEPGYWALVDQSLALVFGEDTGRVVLLVVNHDGVLLHRSEGWPASLRLPRNLPDTAFTDPVPEYPAPSEPPIPPPPPRMRAGPPPDDRPHFDDHSNPLPPRHREDRRGGGGWRRPPPPPPLSDRPVVQLAIATHSLDDQTWRSAVFRDADVTFAIAVELSGYSARVAAAQVYFFAAFAFAIALIAAGSWYLATLVMRPVGRLSDAIAQVTASGLDKRVPNANESEELQQLVDQFNRMMERLERSFTQAARFGADAAHELKTPLAVLQGEIEQALQAAPQETQEVLGRLLDEVQRLKSVTQKLLLLARADAGQLSLHREAIDLSEMIRGLAEDIEVAAPNLQVSADIPRGIVVSADRVLLRQLLQNLADNAVKYNHDGGSIRFVLDAKDGIATLRMSNSGSIPAEKRDRIFDRFVRVDDARNRSVDGAGLGLSLAREIARAHGGDLVLEPGEGIVTFTLTLSLSRGTSNLFQ